ncbi:hypothetical protein IV203_020644 [Nitzschia inconspicua]|uniref:Uncharacterized protein n=1 Tax=Nitzschia inconspicua TaxID=303405 RepID=A0A9K3PDA2_9STRA|nr:hypothetical protein IV203_034425 [Nitzschia inconspicua]KAG7342700.1 hypothetical protein IV203_020644 [Nitzschia inconspicua]
MAKRAPALSPHQDRQGVGEKKLLERPIPFNTPVSPVYPLHPAMRTPEHFVPHSAIIGALEDGRDPSPTPGADAENDEKSDVSSLQCGSVPPNPHYNPAHDPFLLPPQPFTPPTEIVIRIKVVATEAVEEDRQNQSVSPPPEWLQLSDMENDSKIKKAKPRNKRTTTTKKVISDKNGRRRRSSSLTSSDRPKTGRRNAPADLQRSFSDDSLPTFAIKPGMRAQLYQEPPVAEDAPETPPRNNSLLFHRIVIGKHGRPVYADQEEQVELDLADGIEPDATGPSYSFSESYQTSPTIYESSSEQQVAIAQDGVEIGSSPLLQMSELPEQSPPHQPRKGMVRREFQRRFLWFTSSSNKKNKNSSTLAAGKGKSRDRPSKTLSTEWKQSSSSYMV